MNSISNSPSFIFTPLLLNHSNPPIDFELLIEPNINSSVTLFSLVSIVIVYPLILFKYFIPTIKYANFPNFLFNFCVVTYETGVNAPNAAT